MRRPPITFLALTFGLSACATEPSTAPLRGQWGAPDLAFEATGRSAALRLPCDAQAHFAGPIVPDASGRFEVAGAVAERYTAAQVRVTGVLSGSELSLGLRFTDKNGGSETKTVLLRRDVAPDFSQAVCFA